MKKNSPTVKHTASPDAKRSSNLLNALMLSALLYSPLPLLAGPVPGVESFDKKAVEFRTPESLTVWDIGNEEFLVTFKWKPDQPVEKAAVVGTLNDWDPNDLPMEGPDADGFYSVTARLSTGEYRYKFLSDGTDYFADPGNPEIAPEGMGDSLMRLGYFAFLADVTAEKGDGLIEQSALRHNPDEYTFFDPDTSHSVTIRYQTLAQDVESISIQLKLQNNETLTKQMSFAGSDNRFDYFEIQHDFVLDDLKPLSYSFVIRDGETAQSTEEYSFPQEPLKVIHTPEWAKNAIWYQIMIDRFYDGDPTNNAEFNAETSSTDVTHPWISDWYDEKEYERRNGATFWEWSMYERLYGGDIAGLIQKLDYVQDLGVTAIYLNPVFEATNSHKYNATSYIHIDDGYGVAGEFLPTLEKEDRLDPDTWIMNESDQLAVKMIDEIHKRGMKVIFDGVWNHVGDQHPAFLDVKENGQDSRYADWFDIQSWDPFEYSGWAGFAGLPEFKKTETDLVSESLKRHIYGVTKRWMDPNGDGDPSDGIDGWRLDVPMHLPMEFWEEWCAYVREINPEAYIVGEVWDPAEEWLNGKTFDAVMNYQVPKIAFPFFSNKDQKISATEFDRRLARLRLRYPKNHTYVMQNLFDSHDTDRWVSRIANPDLPYDGGNRIQDTGPDYFDERPDAIHYQRLRLMMMFQSTYVGAPMIWYGTEVGMFGADDPHTRMPMWWPELMPYENPEYKIMDDLHDYTRSLFHLRNATPELRTGNYQTAVALDEQDVFGYYRFKDHGSQTILVLLNNSSEEQTITLNHSDPEILPNGFTDIVKLFGDGNFELESPSTLHVTIPPVSGIVLRSLR